VRFFLAPLKQDTVANNRDQQGENIIEIIPHKAQAGYLSGYADPEFIESLQHITTFLETGNFVPSCRWRFHAAT
jgi:hypothetical protein